jgi:small subunit ribosomal protein S9
MPKTKETTKKKTEKDKEKAKKAKTQETKKEAKEKAEKKTLSQKTTTKSTKKEEVKTEDAPGVEVKDKAPKYFEAVGRRKTSTARVRLFTQLLTAKQKEEDNIVVNGKPYKSYFPLPLLQKKITDPLDKLNIRGKFGISILVRGGGISSQADACRHGIARALVLMNPYFRKRLKKAGFLTRDPRMRERKKFGLKRARRAPQWSKR